MSFFEIKLTEFYYITLSKFKVKFFFASFGDWAVSVFLLKLTFRVTIFSSIPFSKNYSSPLEKHIVNERVIKSEVARPIIGCNFR